MRLLGTVSSVVALLLLAGCGSNNVKSVSKSNNADSKQQIRQPNVPGVSTPANDQNKQRDPNNNPSVNPERDQNDGNPRTGGIRPPSVGGTNPNQNQPGNQNQTGQKQNGQQQSNQQQNNQQQSNNGAPGSALGGDYVMPNNQGGNTGGGFRGRKKPVEIRPPSAGGGGGGPIKTQPPQTGGQNPPQTGGQTPPTQGGNQNPPDQKGGPGAGLGGEYTLPNQAGGNTGGGFRGRKKPVEIRPPSAGGGGGGPIKTQPPQTGGQNPPQTGGQTPPTQGGNQNPPDQKGGPGAGLGGEYTLPNQAGGNTGGGFRGRKKPVDIRPPSAGGGGGGPIQTQPPRSTEIVGNVSFSQHIAPVLNQKCGACHVRQAKGRVSMANYKALMDSQIVVASKPDESDLYAVLLDGAENSMPPSGKGTPLTSAEVKNIQKWIQQGAKFDGQNQTTPIAQLGGGSNGSPPPRTGGGPPPRTGGGPPPNTKGGGIRAPSTGGGQGGGIRAPSTGGGQGGGIRAPSTGGGGIRAPSTGGGGSKGGGIRAPSTGGGGSKGGGIRAPSAGGGGGGPIQTQPPTTGGNTNEPFGDNSDNKQPEQPAFDANSWLGYAADEFNKGDETNAFQYLYGHILTQPNGLTDYPLMWVPGLGEAGEPRVALRWGFGIVYNSPSYFKDQPPVVGDPPIRGTNSRVNNRVDRGRNGPDNEFSKYKGVDKSTPAGTMYYYTGDLGDRLVKHLNKRRTGSSSSYGALLQQMPTQDISSVLPKDDNRTSNRPFNRNIANNIREEDLAIDPSAAAKPADEEDEQQVYGTLQPGVMLCGVGSEKDILKRAKNLGLDVVLVLNVTVMGSSRTKVAKKSLTKISVYNATDGKKKYSSSALDHTSVWKTRSTNKDPKRDPVEIKVNQMFEKAGDPLYSLQKLPELKSSQVKDRVAKITANPQNALPVAIEILNYHRKGLLTDDETKASLAKMFGEDGAVALISGSPDEKSQAIVKWLPGSYSVDPQGK